MSAESEESAQAPVEVKVEVDPLLGEQQAREKRRQVLCKKLLCRWAFLESWRAISTKEIYERQEKKRDELLKLLHSCFESNKQWCSTSFSKNISIMSDKKNHDLNLFPSKKIKKDQTTHRVDTIKIIVKNFYTGLLDNLADIGENCLQFIGQIGHVCGAIPSQYFFQFEVARNQYNAFGNILLESDKIIQLESLMFIVIRLCFERYFFEFYKIEDKIKQDDQMNVNLKYICTVIYEMLMSVCIDLTPNQGNNQQSLLPERRNQKRLVAKFPFCGDTKKEFDEANKHEEPLVVGLFGKSDFELIMEDALWVEDLQAVITQLGKHLTQAAKANYEKKYNEEHPPGKREKITYDEHSEIINIIRNKNWK